MASWAAPSHRVVRRVDDAGADRRRGGAAVTLAHLKRAPATLALLRLPRRARRGGRGAGAVRARLRPAGRRARVPHAVRRPARPELGRRAVGGRRDPAGERRRAVPHPRRAARAGIGGRRHPPLRAARLRGGRLLRPRLRALVRRARLADARLRAGLDAPGRPALRGPRRAAPAGHARRPGDRAPRRPRRRRRGCRRQRRARAGLPAQPRAPAGRELRPVAQPGWAAALDHRRVRRPARARPPGRARTERALPRLRRRQAGEPGSPRRRQDRGRRLPARPEGRLRRAARRGPGSRPAGVEDDRRRRRALRRRGAPDGRGADALPLGRAADRDARPGARPGPLGRRRVRPGRGPPPLQRAARAQRAGAGDPSARPRGAGTGGRRAEEPVPRRLAAATRHAAQAGERSRLVAGVPGHAALQRGVVDGPAPRRRALRLGASADRHVGRRELRARGRALRITPGRGADARDGAGFGGPPAAASPCSAGPR